ncbi:MAG: ABC transporter ATP-binding protein [Paludibacter sp.]|nr:ABC transporter ATP-binding protein [Paludibacter sp.]
MSSILNIHNLTIGYSKRKNNTIVQTALNLELKAGEMVCLIGQNGCGKSTLLRTLAGLQKPLSGKVLVKNKELSRIKIHEKAKLLALVLTDRVEIESATVTDIVRMGRQPYCNWWGNLSADDTQMVTEAIAMVHLEHKAECYLNELSDGERQRVMIAKALAQDTPLILLDEPTAHLDLPNRVEIMLLLHKLAHQTGKSVIISTHELDIALQAADRIWLMTTTGVESGVPEDLVLQGHFHDAFQSKAYYFNSANGNFSMNYPMTRKVWVEGDKTRMYWTLRALARAGYMVVQGAQVTVEISTDSWFVDKKELKSVEQLLQMLELKV